MKRDKIPLIIPVFVVTMLLVLLSQSANGQDIITPIAHPLTDPVTTTPFQSCPGCNFVIQNEGYPNPRNTGSTEWFGVTLIPESGKCIKITVNEIDLPNGCMAIFDGAYGNTTPSGGGSTTGGAPAAGFTYTATNDNGQITIYGKMYKNKNSKFKITVSCVDCGGGGGDPGGDDPGGGGNPCDNMLYYNGQPVANGTVIQKNWDTDPQGGYYRYFEDLEARGMYDLVWTSSPSYNLQPDNKQPIYASDWYNNGILYESPSSAQMCKTFTVTGKYLVEGENLVTNGDFSGGNTGFNSVYTYKEYTSSLVGNGILFEEGTYSVGSDARYTHKNFTGYGHGGSSNNAQVSGDPFLIANGDDQEKNVWCQTIAVEKNTDYVFNTWVKTLSGNIDNNPQYPAILGFTINGNSLGTFNAPIYKQGASKWTQFHATWNSGNNTSVTICIKAITTHKDGNDFGLDDIFFGKTGGECTGSITLCAGSGTPPPCNLTVSSTKTDITCNGNADGTITVTAQQGTAPYTIEWGGQQTTSSSSLFTIQNLPAGSYTVVVTDANNCTATTTQTIVEPPALTVTTGNDTSVCEGQPIPLQATATGGTSPYTYSWNGPSYSSSQQNPIIQAATQNHEGTYTVTVTDKNKCTNTASTKVTVVEAPTHTTDTSMCADVLATTGFHWVVGTAIDETFTEAGTYTRTIPADGGSTSETIEVNASANGQTYNGCDYVFTNLGYSSSYKPTTAETYTLTIKPTDENSQIKVTVAANDFSATATSCYIQIYDGTTVSGTGTKITSNTSLPLTVTSTNHAITLKVNYARKKETKFRITAICDPMPLSCGSTEILNLTENPVPTASMSHIDQICETKGQATVTPNNGTPPYEYEWNTTPTQQTGTATDLEAGTYTVTVTDKNGCVVTKNVTIEDQNPLTVSSTKTDITCNGDADGKIKVTAQQGTSPYTIEWGDQQTTSNSSPYTIQNLPAGNYTVTVTDKNGCTATTTQTIVEPPALTVTLSPETTICEGKSTTLNATPTNGQNYQWSANPSSSPKPNNGNPSGTVNPTESTTYTVTVTDSKGCTGTASTKVTVNPSPTVSIVPDEPTVCNGGDITLTASSNPSNDATYQWSGPGINGTKTGAALNLTNAQQSTAGEYTVTATVADCEGTASTTVTVLPSYDNIVVDSTVCGSDLPITWNGETFKGSDLTNTEKKDTITRQATLQTNTNPSCDSIVTMRLIVLPTQRDTIRDTICGETLRNTGYTWHRDGIGSGQDVDTLIGKTGIYHYTIPGSQAKSGAPARSAGPAKSGAPATVTHVEMNDAMPATVTACPVVVVTGPDSDGTRKMSSHNRQSGDYYLTIMPCEPGQRIRLEVVEYYSAAESSYLEIYGGTRAAGTPVRLGKDTAVPALVIDRTNDVSGAFTLHAHVKGRKGFGFRVVAASNPQ